MGFLAQHDGQVPELIGVIKEGVVAGAQFSAYEEAVCQVQQISNGAEVGDELPFFAKNLMPSQEKIFELDGPAQLWDAARSLVC